MALKLLFSLLALLLIVAPPAAFAQTYIVNGLIPAADQAQTGEDMKKLQVAGNYTTFTDFPLGYQITYPKSMKADVTLSALRSVFADKNTRIEVYYDDLTGTDATAEDYIYYGRRFTKNVKDHTILLDRAFSLYGYKVHLLKWVRRPLSRLPVDRRYYATAEIIKSPREVYTIFIKSASPITNEMDIINSFRIINKQGTAGMYLPLEQTHPVFNKETADFFNAYFSEASPLSWGIFQPEAPDVMQHLEKLEQRLDYQFPFLVRYQQLGDEVPLRALQIANVNRKHVELTLQTFFYDKDNTGVMYDILDGKYDDYFRNYAKDLKSFSHPVLLRFNNEMNGDWCQYSSYHSAKDTEIYKSVWRYVYSIFKAEAVDNVLWVWNPHDRSFPNFSWNHYLTYYPGDDVVDIIGITGYNTGNYFPGETWREFSDIYIPIYSEYTSIFNKPLMITEFGANSFGGNKAAWIGKMFQEMKRFDKIKVAIWWSGTDWDSEGRAGRIYRLDENDAVLDAFRDGLAAYNSRANTSKSNVEQLGQHFSLKGEL